MKRHFVAIPTDDGGIELFAMKEWLRQHLDRVPQGLDPSSSTSHSLRAGLRRAGWTVQESETDVRVIRPEDRARVSEVAEVLDSDADEQDDQDDALSDSPAFALEHQLRDFMAENLGAIPIGGRNLRLHVDPTGRDGIEFPTAVGPIDILAVDANGDFYVFELKRARAPDRAVGQLARYMGWVKHTIGRGHRVYGVVVARRIDERLRYAATVIPDVMLLEYQVQFQLTAANHITAPPAPSA